jgi:Flp pilus assembly protein CpaB
VSTSPTLLVVRARRVLVRPGVRRLAIAALAAATAVTVMSLVDAAGAARDRWGDTRPVVVARRDLAPGEVLDAGSVETRDLPVAVVAEAALAEAPAGAVVRQPIAAGEPLVAGRLAPAGLTGAAALVPPGERAVAVPAGPAGRPPVAVGDRVDVMAVMPAGAFPPAVDAESGPSASAFSLVERAVVVDVTDEAVTVTVPVADAPRVAWALASGSIAIALAGG